MFYATLGSEVLRIGKATSHLDDFVESICSLLTRMRGQGAENQAIGKVLRKMYGRHNILHKFATNARSFTNLLMV